MNIREMWAKIKGLDRGTDTEKPKGRRKALVVGFGRYGQITRKKIVETPSGPMMVPETKKYDLSAPPHDALAMATKLLSRKKDVRNFEVTLMADPRMEDGKEVMPSLPGIEVIEQGERCWCDVFEEQVERLFADSQADDTLLLYFSGHGSTSKDGMPGLTVPKYPGEEGKEQFVNYPLLRLFDVIAQHEFKHCVLILDSCFSGNIARLFQDKCAGLKSGLTILTAGQEDHRVSALGDGIEIGKTQADWEVSGRDLDEATPLRPREGFPSKEDIEKRNGDRQHKDVEVNYSFFTSYLIEAIVGGAADPLGVVTTLSAYQFVSEAMGFNKRIYTDGQGEEHSHSRPMLITNTDDAVVLNVVNTMLNDTDLLFLHNRFTDPNWFDAALANQRAILKDKMLRVSNVTGHPQVEKTVRKLLVMGLIERKKTDGSTLSTEYYRLTGRGKHYRDMVEHLHDTLL